MDAVIKQGVGTVSIVSRCHRFALVKKKHSGKKHLVKKYICVTVLGHVHTLLYILSAFCTNFSNFREIFAFAEMF